MTAFLKHTALLLALGLAACGGSETPPAGDADQEPEAPGLKTDVGVDAAAKVIKIGALNDESGPAAAIGKPFANGKRLLAARINAGGSGLLPEGWKVELVEKDHAYNPQNSVQAFNEIKGDVLFIGTSFGTPNTLPLRPHLEKEKRRMKKQKQKQKTTTTNQPTSSVTAVTSCGSASASSARPNNAASCARSGRRSASR